jgi:hypothetical protein
MFIFLSSLLAMLCLLKKQKSSEEIAAMYLFSYSLLALRFAETYEESCGTTHVAEV